MAANVKKNNQYIFMSSPSTHNIYYASAPSFHTMTLPADERAPTSASILIDGEASRCQGEGCDEDSDKGLRVPHGLALYREQHFAVLYVSDEEADNIYAYEIAGGNGIPEIKATARAALGGKPSPYVAGLQVGRQRLIREGVGGSVYGLAVDGQGNLFYTVETGQIEMLKADELKSGFGTASGSEVASRLTPVVLYTAQEFDSVSSPTGIASDGYRVYWANRDGGNSYGTVATAPEQPGAPISLAANGAKAFGVCLARGNVFYTGDTQSLFAVKANGGAIAEISRNLQKPRGCAYDGEDTIYVSDAEADAVYTLPAISTLRGLRHLSAAVAVEGPSQLALYVASDDELRGPMLQMHSDSARSRALSSAFFVGLGVIYATLFNR